MKKNNLSRIGKKSILIPEKVTAQSKNNQLIVKGPKGELSLRLRPEIEIKLDKDKILVLLRKKSKISKALHGLTRSVIANMITGVLEGYSKKLKLVGTGYRAKIEDEKLILLLGFSHPVIITPKEGINFEVEGDDFIKISGFDKQLVGETAAAIREIAKPEPYKGKGIRYEGEEVRKKPGKAAKIGEVAS